MRLCGRTFRLKFRRGSRTDHLSYLCVGRPNGSLQLIIRHVRGLGDIVIFKAYLLLVWSEWDRFWASGSTEMQVSIRENFSGIGLHHFRQHKPEIDEYNIKLRKAEYRRLKNVLLEVDRREN